MELENNHQHHVKRKPVSVLKDDGFCASRILARENSVGQSSRIFYRTAEGIPFKWEMQPGTPKNPQEDDIIPPPSPSPLMQSLGLPLPNLDHEEPPKGKTLKIWSLNKIVKKTMRRSSSKPQESSRFGDSDGEFVASVKDSSFSSNSSSLSLSPEQCIVDSSGLPRDSVDGPFCCSPWNVSAILDEGNTRIYYCRHHKIVFAGEDVSFLVNQFSGPFHSETTPAGVPFDWETKPGTPKNTVEVNELIPPPSPPPALESSSMHIGEEKAITSKLKRAWFWIRSKYKTRKNKRVRKDISFRYHDDGEFDASFRKSASLSLSSVAPFSKGSWRMSKMKRSLNGGHFSCGPWSRREILVFATRKFKLFAF